MFIHSFIPIPLHPLFWITISLIAGINAAHMSSSIIFCAPIIIIPLIIFIKFMGGKLALRNIFFFIIVIASFYGGVFRYLSLKADHNQITKTLTKAPSSLEGTIIDQDVKKGKTIKCTTTLKVTRIMQAGKSFALRTVVKLTTFKKNNWSVGDHIIIDNIVFKTQSKSANGHFLLKEGITGMSFITNPSFQLIERPRISLRRWISKTRARIVHNLSRKLSKRTFVLFNTLFLGGKTGEDFYYREMKRQFATWGIAHFLARSGLHIVLVIGLWRWLLTFMPLPFLLKQFLLLFLALLYHLLSWSTISFARALITLIIYKLCVLQKLSYHTLYIFHLVTFMVLIYNPFQLVALDFQLSFGITFALAWFNERTIQAKRLKAD